MVRRESLFAWAAEFSADMAGAAEHFTALRDAVAGEPRPALADALAGRLYALRDLGQFPEAADDARRALAVAREVGHPFAEAGPCWTSPWPPRPPATWASRAAGPAGREVPGDIPPSITRACSVWLTEVWSRPGLRRRRRVLRGRARRVLGRG